MVKKKCFAAQFENSNGMCKDIFMFFAHNFEKRHYYLRELQKYLRSNCIFTYMQDLMSFGQWPILSLVRRTILLPFDKFQRFFGKSASDADKELDFTLNFLADQNLLKEKCTILTFFILPRRNVSNIFAAKRKKFRPTYFLHCCES